MLTYWVCLELLGFADGLDKGVYGKINVRVFFPLFRMESIGIAVGKTVGRASLGGGLQSWVSFYKLVL